MKFIGLLMINNEDDILEETLATNAQYVDAFYVLDGTVPNDDSKDICMAHRKCSGYTTDAWLPQEYGDKPKDGWRQHLYEQAVADHGYDNWFLLLHGDEVWTFDPRDVADDAHGYFFLLPFYFPRAGEQWDNSQPPLEQLRWHLSPGYPEFRMFRGGEHVQFDPLQHFDVRPKGLGSIAKVPLRINHYLYRSPDQQRARAQLHQQTGFDPGNYNHIIEHDGVYWTDEMIAAYQAHPAGYFTELEHDGAVLEMPKRTNEFVYDQPIMKLDPYPTPRTAA